MMTEKKSSLTHIIERGTIIYKKKDYNIELFEVVSIHDDGFIKIKRLSDGHVRRSSNKVINNEFSISHTFLLREILADLDERRDEIITELGTYDYKVMMGEIWPK